MLIKRNIVNFTISVVDEVWLNPDMHIKATATNPIFNVFFHTFIIF